MKKKSAASRRWFHALLPSRDGSAQLRRVLERTLIAGATLVLCWGAWHLKQEVDGSERFRLENWRLDLGELPEWVTPEIAASISSLSPDRLPRSLDLFRKGVLRDFVSALEASPWVAEASVTDLVYPTSATEGVVRAVITLRAPVAIVQAGGRFYLADATGMRLGEPYAESPASWFRVPVIRGAVEPLAIPAPGERWTAQDVLEGLAVARVLHNEGIHRQYPASPIETVDVSDVKGRSRRGGGEIVLISRGRELEWGRSPLSKESGTTTLAQLVANLRYVLSHIDELDYGRIKLQYGVIERS